MILESITFAGVAAIAAKISPFVAVGKGAVDLTKYAAQWKHVESAGEVLKQTKVDIAKVTHGPDLDKFLDHWLTHGEMIFPYVKQKLLNRFIVVVATVISVQIAAAELRGISTEDTAINVGQILVQMAAALIVTRHTIIDEHERTFLRFLTGLRTVWYAEYVLPTVTAFNETFSSIVDRPATGKTEWDRKYGAISMRFQEAQKEQEQLLNEIQQRLLKARNADEQKAAQLPADSTEASK